MIVNVSGYRFVDLPDRDELRGPMLERCLGLSLLLQRKFQSFK